MKSLNLFLKRLTDILGAGAGLVLLSPFLLVVALLVRIKLGSPILFKQDRPGLHEKIFTLYKFRTMTNQRDGKGELLPDTQRLSKFGRFLRSTSLDELPELVNILKGDMSIVGPRPLAVQYLPFYTEKERMRHSVRPGLTGLAQINGRNTITWEERFGYDIEYVENISARADLLIIWKTIKKVIERESIGERGVDSPIDFDIYRQQEQREKQEARL